MSLKFRLRDALDPRGWNRLALIGAEVFDVI